MANDTDDTSAKMEEREAAILELLTLCAEKNVKVPEHLRSAILLEEDKEKQEPGEGESLLESLRKERASVKIDDDELVKELRGILQALKIDGFPKLSMQVTNGSYTVKIPSGKKARINTVLNQSPLYKLRKKVRKMLIEHDYHVGTTLEEKTIMDGVNLTFESGKNYLVLGAPGSGKSTLLKMLANTLRRDKKNVLGGSVAVNGFKPDDEGIVWSNLIAYIDQIDRLHKFLTVGETCDFAWKCRSGGTHAKAFYQMDDPEVAAKVKELDEKMFQVVKILDGMGLLRVKDTFVGDNESVRGVSGGEKKRVTVAEMMCTGVPILCCDEISTGLDAATTYDIVKLYSAAAAIFEKIHIISLLQPPPETVALFDEIILLDSGRIIYSGPIDDVLPHFKSIGYQIPDRMDLADWLQTLPTQDGEKYLIDESQTHLTTEEFVERYNSSSRGLAVTKMLKEQIEKEDSLPMQVAKQRYQNTSWNSLKLLTQRELLLWWRDQSQIKARVAQDVMMGLIAGTLFWQQNDDPQSVVGILFQSMFFVSAGAMVKIPEQFEPRGILYKQQDANFFPTWTFVVGRSLAAIPVSVMDGLLYGTIVYWFVGLAAEEGGSIWNFFIFMLLILAGSLCAGLVFSVFSAVMKDKNTAQASMSVALVVFVLFSGFTVQPDVIPPYYIWIYWINMFGWIFRSLVVNEYQSGKYDTILPGTDGLTKGEAILTQFGFTQDGEPYEFGWVWYGLAFAVGFSLIAVGASAFFLEHLRYESGKGAVVDDDENDVDGVEIDDKVMESEEVSIPFQKVNLTFKGMHYTVKASTSDEDIELLKGVDGVIESGNMTALMGSSGAGKTTLMDVLALRKSSGKIEGEVRLNGHLQEEKSFRRCTGYVEQFDVQSPQLTIRETMEFSARLRLEETDPSVTTESIEKFVNQTLAQLELTNIQHLQVGSDLLGGLSFEQKKRLSIGVELVANPSILFLDEPTSGLDARAASIVMRGLKRIALSGRAVCATIHQPSIAIFNSFDSLLLLKRGGEVVFFGELGDESSNLISYFERYRATPKIQPGENPATWMLTTIGAGSSTTGSKPFDYSQSYAVSTQREETFQKIELLDQAAEEENRVVFPGKYATSTSTQRKLVVKRAMTVYWRSPSYNLVRIIVSAVVALLFGSVFAAQRTPENESDMNSRVSSIFISFLFLAVNALNTSLGVFEVERNMFYRHKAALMYDQRAMLLAFTVAEIPFLLMASMVFVVCFYFLVGFEVVAYKFLFYYLFFTLNLGVYTFTGHLLMSVFPDSVTAQGFGGIVVGLSSLFAGVIIRPQNIKSFWTFAYWAVPSHYIFEGLVTSQFNNDDTPIEPSAGSAFCAFVATSNNECAFETCTECQGTAEEWIDVSFGGKFDYDHIPWNILYLICAVVFGKICTYIALTRLNYLAK